MALLRLHLGGFNMLVSAPTAKVVSIWPLDKETRSHLPTREAARHLNREAQTLRKWAVYARGPIQPVRIGGQLAWPVAELRRITGAA
jgi:hypothetical protein